MKKKIIVLATGGTIASSSTENGLEPTISVHDIVSGSLPALAHCDIECIDILSLDSSNIQPEEWQIIAQKTAEAAVRCDGIVITHGTDTMAYTMSALSFMLQNIPVPVVFTGSQLPYEHPLTDAIDNVRCAVMMALSGRPGVFLAFDRKIMLGCRCVKVRTTGFDAFESINYPNVGQVDSSGLQIYDELLPPASGGAFRPETDLCRDVFLLKLTPGLDPSAFDYLIQRQVKGVMIEAFGLGGLHYVHRDLYEKLIEMKKLDIPVVIASQCLYERSDLSKYAVGRLAMDNGAISAQDMTSEAAFTKLMWVLGRTGGIEKVREWFSRNLTGEISLISPA